MTSTPHTPTSVPSSPSPTGGWASGSIAVIVPVHATSTRTAATQPDAVPAVWDLKGLRRAGLSLGNRLSQPNVVAWNPLTDARVTSTQRGASYALFRGAATENGTTEVDEGAPVDDVQGSGGTADTAAADAARAALPLPAQAYDSDYTDRWTMTAIELFHFPTDVHTTIRIGTELVATPTTYVVVHLIAKPEALRDIAAAIGYFSAPYTHTDQRRERWPVKKLNKLLVDLDFPQGSPTSRPFIISHLVPDQTLPAAGEQLLGAEAHGWTHEQIWAWRLASGANLSVDNEPGWAPHAATRNGFWAGSTWCRVEDTGAAFIATRSLDELPTTADHEAQVWWRNAEADPRRRQHIEHVRLEGYAHRTAVDIAILAKRQHAFLDTHATTLLAAVPLNRSVPAVGPDTAMLAARLEELRSARATALNLELEFTAFRNELWFTHVPGDAVTTAALAALHHAFGADRLMDDIEAEQRDITRILGLAAEEAATVVTQAQHQAALAAQRAAAATEKAQKAVREAALAAEEAREKRRALLDKIITFLAPLIAVPGVVLAFVQTIQDSTGRRTEFWIGTAVMAALVVASWAVLWFLLLRKTDDTTTSTSEEASSR